MWVSPGGFGTSDGFETRPYVAGGGFGVGVGSRVCLSGVWRCWVGSGFCAPILLPAEGFDGLEAGGAVGGEDAEEDAY